MRVYILNHHVTGRHFIVAAVDAFEAFKKVDDELFNRQSNWLNHVNNYEQLTPNCDLVCDAVKATGETIISIKEFTNTMNIIDCAEDRGIHARTVLNGLCCHISVFDSKGATIREKSTVVRPDLFKWWKSNADKIIVIGGRT